MAQNPIDLINPDTPGPIVRPFDQSMASLPTLWGRLTIGLHNGREPLQAAIAEAETLDGSIVAEVRAVGRLAGPPEIKTFLRMLVSAWPNASQNDLAGFGMQLSQDVEEQRPSKFALAEAARALRRTARFLPSISEVLDAIAAADKPMASVLRTIDRVPEALERAKRELAASDDRLRGAVD